MNIRILNEYKEIKKNKLGTSVVIIMHILLPFFASDGQNWKLIILTKQDVHFINSHVIIGVVRKMSATCYFNISFHAHMYVCTYVCRTEE